MKALRKKIFSVISLNAAILCSLFLTIMLILPGCYFTQKDTSPTIDMIVVFKKNVQVEKANSILFEKGYIFFEGTDSSKGKAYFQNTGPKYIVKVPPDKITSFSEEMKNIFQVYEVYRADWTIEKD
jgi:hypothetical protein